MKRMMLTVAFTVAGLAFAGCQEQLYAPNEPAAVMFTNAGPENQARDLYQQPYPGPFHYATPADPFPDERP